MKPLFEPLSVPFSYQVLSYSHLNSLINPGPYLFLKLTSYYTCPFIPPPNIYSISSGGRTLNGQPVFAFVRPFLLFSFLFLPIYRKVNAVNAACGLYYDQAPFPLQVSLSLTLDTSTLSRDTTILTTPQPTFLVRRKMESQTNISSFLASSTGINSDPLESILRARSTSGTAQNLKEQSNGEAHLKPIPAHLESETSSVLSRSAICPLPGCCPRHRWEGTSGGDSNLFYVSGRTTPIPEDAPPSAHSIQHARRERRRRMFPTVD